MGLVVFSHGRDSGPNAAKIQALAPIAERRGWTVLVPDYTGTKDPDERVSMLLEMLLREGRQEQELVLVGSSMGAYVSIVVSERLQPAGLFLMAPAVFVEGYRVQEPLPRGGKVLVIHGWDDQVVPPEAAIEFCRRNRLDLFMVDGDHGLRGRIPFIERAFDNFLERVNPAGPG